MDKRSMVISVLEDMGYQPRVDSDGDVLFRFQMKHLYVLATQQEETSFLVVMLPQFYEMSEGEEIKVLTLCNKLTREVRLAKIYIDTNSRRSRPVASSSTAMRLPCVCNWSIRW